MLVLEAVAKCWRDKKATNVNAKKLIFNHEISSGVKDYTVYTLAMLKKKQLTFTQRETLTYP